jgi:hypothetical protein
MRHRTGIMQYRMCGGLCSSGMIPCNSASGRTVIYIDGAIQVWVMSVHRTFKQIHFFHVCQSLRRWKYIHAMYVVAGDVISHLLCGLISSL